MEKFGVLARLFFPGMAVQRERSVRTIENLRRFSAEIGRVLLGGLHLHFLAGLDLD